MIRSSQDPTNSMAMISCGPIAIAAWATDSQATWNIVKVVGGKRGLKGAPQSVRPLSVP